MSTIVRSPMGHPIAIVANGDCDCRQWRPTVDAIFTISVVATAFLDDALLKIAIQIRSPFWSLVIANGATYGFQDLKKLKVTQSQIYGTKTTVVITAKMVPMGLNGNF